MLSVCCLILSTLLKVPASVAEALVAVASAEEAEAEASAVAASEAEASEAVVPHHVGRQHVTM